jgi:hypothetical protein
MHADYSDIIDRINIRPLWFDEHAVPRYDIFQPKLIANIYAKECVLLRIECQGCGHEFEVAMSQDQMANLGRTCRPSRSDCAPLAMQIAEKSIHYGDPPNIGCCASGPTMSCVDRKVLEYWHSGPDTNYTWTREPSCEVDIDTEDYGEHGD